MIKVFADSCCDYHNDNGLFQEVERIPLTISVNGNEYVDTINVNTEKLLQDIAADKDVAKTACPSPFAYLNALNKANADENFIVTLSSKLSGSYNSAVLAANMFTEDHPKKKVHVFDSKSAAAGELVVVNQIFEQIEANKSFNEIVNNVEALIAKENKLYFILENLETLKKNGRLTKIQEVITSIARIKLLLSSNEGEIAVSARALSTKQAIVFLIKKLSSIDLSAKTLFITECNSRGLAEELRNRVLKFCKVKNIEIFKASGLSSVYENSGGIIIAY